MSEKDTYHHGTLRRSILDQAFRSLEAGGLEGLSIRGLAETAGVSKTAPYRHFAGKQDLLVTMAAEGFRDFADRLEAALSAVVPAADPAHRIRTLYRAYLGFARERPQLYRLMFSRLGYSLHSESCRAHSVRAIGCLVRAVEAAQAEGWRAGQETMSLVLSLWAGVHGWAGILMDDLAPEGITADGRDIHGLTEALID